MTKEGIPKLSHKNLYLDNNALATTLMLATVDAFGLEVTTWDPETTKSEIEMSFNIELPSSNFNKLMAALEIMTSDTFYTNLPAFIRLNNALFDGALVVETFDPATTLEMACGILEALLIWPPEVIDHTLFTPEIMGYIMHTMIEEVIIKPPSVIADIGITADMLGSITTFGDDPALAAAVTQMANERTNEINLAVRNRLKLLVEQINALQFAGVEYVDAVTAIKGALAEMDRAITTQAGGLL